MKYEKKFKELKTPQEKLLFLRQLRTEQKIIQSFLTEKKDWVLEQSDTNLKTAGISYAVVKATTRLSEKKLRESNSQLYMELIDQFGYEIPERIDVRYKGVK